MEDSGALLWRGACAASMRRSSVPGIRDQMSGIRMTNEYQQKAETERNAARVELNMLDLQSIRALREVVLAMADGEQPDAQSLAVLWTSEGTARSQREKLR